ADDNGGLLPPLFCGAIDALPAANPNHFKFHTHGRWALTADFGPVNNVGVLVCPSDRPPQAVPGLRDANGNPTTVYSSYGYNYELYLTDTLLQNVKPSEIAFAMDGDGGYDLQVGVWYGDLDPSHQKTDLDRYNSQVVTLRHTKRFNCLFLDCHV